jgi:hypothetical protein
MLKSLTRGQKILAAAALIIIVLFVTGVSTQQRSGGSADPTENGLVKMLGGWFGGPDQAEPGELSAPCLADRTLSIELSCVLTVAPSGKDLREVTLRTDQPLHVKTRAPQGTAELSDAIEAGAEIKVSVDGDGADITLSCEKCSVTVGG